jgi:cell division protein FtsB
VIVVTLCQLWAFIVTSIDVVLFKYQDEIGQYKVQQAEMVEQQVALFRGNLEQKIFGLKRLVAELKEEIEKLNTKLADVNTENYDVKQALQKESELIQSFKDPEGMSGFRVVL